MISTVSSGVKSDKQFLTAGDDVRLKNSLKEGKSSVNHVCPFMKLL
jgi:hypothetical protein